MHVRIGAFNQIPLYLEISPLQWFRNRNIIAAIRYKAIFYDQLKAKHEGSISPIPREDLPKDDRFISWMLSFDRIVAQPGFLLLPKINKLFTLWHEYGHSVVSLGDGLGDKSAFYDVYEAMADFYACCKLKLRFDEYTKIYFSPHFDLEKKRTIICFLRNGSINST